MEAEENVPVKASEARRRFAQLKADVPVLERIVTYTVNGMEWHFKRLDWGEYELSEIHKGPRTNDRHKNLNLYARQRLLHVLVKAPDDPRPFFWPDETPLNEDGTEDQKAAWEEAEAQVDEWLSDLSAPVIDQIVSIANIADRLNPVFFTSPMVEVSGNSPATTPETNLAIVPNGSTPI